MHIHTKNKKVININSTCLIGPITVSGTPLVSYQLICSKSGALVGLEHSGFDRFYNRRLRH